MSVLCHLGVGTVLYYVYRTTSEQARYCTVLNCNVCTVPPRSRYTVDTVLYNYTMCTSEQLTASRTDTTSTELPCSPPALVPPATTSTGNSHLSGKHFYYQFNKSHLIWQFIFLAHWRCETLSYVLFKTANCWSLIITHWARILDTLMSSHFMFS